MRLKDDAKLAELKSPTTFVLDPMVIEQKTKRGAWCTRCIVAGSYYKL